VILYKYYPCDEYTYESLAVRGLWCHHSKNMNDPFECLGQSVRQFDSVSLSAFRSTSENTKNTSLLKARNLDDEALGASINKLRDLFISKHAFCGLSETPDNVLMWSHYAANHTGIVLGIDFSEMVGTHHLQKVNYVSDLPKFDPVKLALFMDGDDSQVDYLFKDLSVKSADWSYEREWRIWLKAPGYHQYSSEQVKEIYFGVNGRNVTKHVVAQLTNYLPNDFQFDIMEFGDNPVRLVWK